MFWAPYTLLTGNPAVAYASFLIAAVAIYNFESIDPDRRVENTPTEEINRQYDFIVVGAGAAGSVVASRLSEVAEWSVLLLEAGGDETVISEVPYLFNDLQGTKLDWQFKTEPSKTICQAQPHARCDWPRGKLLGGTSSINGMQYNRGNKKDFDQWESLGNPGWSYQDVLPYFLKSEDNRIPELRNSPYHSTGGPLTISRASFLSRLADSFLRAWEELGYPTRDINGESQTGFMLSQLFIRDGRRCSTAKAFLRPVRKRPNLHIAMHCFVTKVLVDPDTKVAYGVELVRDEETYTVTARKEVILSAGALQTPQLLMLSGIGPKSDLQKFSIPVLKNLKVGYNLQDHVQIADIDFIIDQPLVNNEESLDVVNAVLDYAEDGSGVLSRIHVEVMGNVNTKFANVSDDWPDVQICITPVFNIDTTELDMHPRNPLSRFRGCEEQGQFRNSTAKNAEQSFIRALNRQRRAPGYVRPIKTFDQADSSVEYSRRPPSAPRPSKTFDQADSSVEYSQRPPYPPRPIKTYDNSAEYSNQRPSYRPTKTYDQIESSEELSNQRPSYPLRPITTYDSSEELGQRPTRGSDTFSLYIVLLRPNSKGRIKLRSSNPFEYPIFKPNYLSERIDLQTMLEGIKIGLKMGKTRTMRHYGSRLNYTNPNCTHVPLYSDAFWECAIRHSGTASHHQVGTCKMGPKWDPDAVVDSELRVYGIKSLRVIDASIMPFITNGNIEAPTVMIAEKGADFIKETWLLDYEPLR